jgi:hypothetical protein
MATFAQNTLGTGVSKVYVASEKSLEINLPTELQKSISFVRVSPWYESGKKGIGAKGNDVVDALDVSWFYDWGNSDVSVNSREYVVMNWGGDPSYEAVTGFGQKMELNHHLAFNEPGNEDQSNMAVDVAVERYEKLQASGLRLGSPGNTDNAKGAEWRNEFMRKAFSRGLRIDFIAVHYYKKTTAQNFYNWLKAIYDLYHLPIWITEFNYGATWTDPGTVDVVNAGLQSYVSMLDTTSFVERYAVFTWQPPSTMSLMSVRNPVTLNETGLFYKEHQSPLAFFSEEYEQGPDLSLGFLTRKSHNINLSVFPNPVKNGFMYVNLKEGGHSGDFEICIYDLGGNILLKQNNDDGKVDVCALPSGIYLLKVTSAKGESTEKIVIE